MSNFLRLARYPNVAEPTRTLLVRWKRMLASSLCLALVCGGGSALLSANAQGAGTWNVAIEAPGTPSLSVVANATIDSVSCSAAGYCGAIGTYTDSSHKTEAFVANETKGTWASAIALPGYVTLNAGGVAGTTMLISCSASGDCSAGGSFTDAANHLQAFLVSESNGTWGSALAVPGLAALNAASTSSELFALSCSSAGDCSAGGDYTNATALSQAFVIDEVNGTWGSAVEAPGTDLLNAGGGASVVSLDCRSNANCAAVGVYTDASGNGQAFVMDEASGTWGTASEIQGLDALNAGGLALPYQVSCGAAGNCSAVGEYTDAANNLQAFVVSEANDTWGSAIEAPGTSALNAGGNAGLESVSCASVGDCSASGSYLDAASGAQAFVVSETNGTWGSAVEASGSGALNAGAAADLTSISCASVGNCKAVGAYTDSSNRVQALVIAQSNGTWGTASELPGTAALNMGGNAFANSVSCAGDGTCSVGGFYADSSGNTQAFVDASAPDVVAPGRPSIRASSAASGEVSVAVLGRASNGANAASGYQYSLNGGRWIRAAGGSSGRFHINHLAARLYRIRVRAVNAAGRGIASRAVTVRVV